MFRLKMLGFVATNTDAKPPHVSIKMVVFLAGKCPDVSLKIPEFVAKMAAKKHFPVVSHHHCPLHQNHPLLLLVRM